MRFVTRFAVISFALSTFVACGSHEESAQFSNRKNRDVSFTGTRFPSMPEASVTPGSVCDRPSEYRYPERIKYCNRDVEPETKRQIFEMYDARFGYETTKMDRTQFKIDHLIPLCMGGSNQTDNLWPQHVSIYQNTDPLEPFLCEVLAHGKITQAEAISLILDAKRHPADAKATLSKLEARF